MQRALLAALFTGLAAPAVGTYLVQRRLALMGDGIGHVAVTGVALGLLTGTSPTWTAVVVAVSAPSLIEVIREQRPHQRRRRPGAAVLRRHRRRRAAHRPRRAERGHACKTLPVRLDHHDLRGPTSWSRWCWPLVVVVVRGRAVPAAVRGRPGPGVRPGRRPQRARLQPAGRGAGRGHRHGRDAHGRPAAGQRADGGAGRHRPAAHPRLPDHAGRRDGAWARSPRSAGVAVVGRTLDVAPGATIVLLALAGFAATYPVGVLAAATAAAAAAVRRARGRVPAATTGHTAVPEDHAHEHGAGLRPLGRAARRPRRLRARRPPPRTPTGATMTSTEPAAAARRAPGRPGSGGRSPTALESFDDFRSAQEIHDLLRQRGEQRRPVHGLPHPAGARRRRRGRHAAHRGRRGGLPALLRRPTTTTWSAAPAARPSRSRARPWSGGPTRSPASTASPTSATPWRSSAPARTAAERGSPVRPSARRAAVPAVAPA